MIAYINGSPRLEKSNSEYFLRLLKANDIIYLYKDNYEKIKQKIIKSELLVLSFPLYIDCLPNRVIEFIEYIEENNIDLNNKKIYVICNCGFLEWKHNLIVTSIIKKFARKNKAKYSGSFLIGAGEVVGSCKKNKIYKLVCLDFFFKIKKFKKFIEKKKYIDLHTTIKPMWKKLYVFLANKNWKKSMKQNGIIN